MSTAIQVSRSDIIGLCRLCLAKDLAEIDIFETGSEYRQLFTKIVTCLPVEVTQNEDLPTRICEVCNSKVDNFYQFWTSTAKNQKQLQEWLKTATDEIKKTDITTIKVEADDPRGEDYEPEDYDDDHRGDSYDEEEDAPSAPKRIKIQHSSDIEEDTKPSKLVLDSASNGASTSKTKKSTKETWFSSTTSQDEYKKLVATGETKCPRCSKQFDKPLFMRKHLKEVHSSSQHPCALCMKSFKSLRLLRTHLKVVHHGKKRKYATNFECYDCGQKFYAKMFITEHICNQHLGINYYTCSLCPATFSSNKRYKHHKNKHAKIQGPLPEPRSNEVQDTGDLTKEQWNELVQSRARNCPVCKKKYARPTGMRRHLREVHSSQKKYSCDLCQKQFTSSGRVTQHKRNFHFRANKDKPKELNYECFYCGLKYASKLHLSEHIPSHTGIKPHVCHLCQNTYTSKKALTRHLKRHAQLAGELAAEDMFPCDVCGKMFLEHNKLMKHKSWVHGDKCHVCKVCGARIKGSIQKHMLSHTGERPYCCHICGKSLKGKLKEHMLTHTGERPYACEICGSTFKDKWYLGVHMRKHNGEKPYVCDFCGQSFAARPAYTTHLKKHTEKEVLKGHFECQICRHRFITETELATHFTEHFGVSTSS